MKPTKHEPIRIARYYPAQKRFTYFIADKIQVTTHGLTEAEARALIRRLADGPKELVQKLEIVPTTKV